MKEKNISFVNPRVQRRTEELRIMIVVIQIDCIESLKPFKATTKLSELYFTIKVWISYSFILSSKTENPFITFVINC